MRKFRLFLVWKILSGLLICIFLVPQIEALRGSAVVLQAKAKNEEEKSETDADGSPAIAGAVNATKPPLTGIPQIDYLQDPNLPRELNGYNLSDYPFYDRVPPNIVFNCDNLHDGFYASVAHKCQVYHHCLGGTRFDFLCANYTAFDQRTFICHFVSEIDCVNSPKYFSRNDALYKATTTTTIAPKPTPPPTTTTTQQPPKFDDGRRHGGGNGGGNGGGRRRWPAHRRRRPSYQYYYDDEYSDADYYQDEIVEPRPSRKHRPQHQQDPIQDIPTAPDPDYEVRKDRVKPSVRSSNIPSHVFEKPRPPPKIRRPVPKNEREKYDYQVKEYVHTTSPSIVVTQQPAQQNISSRNSPEDGASDEEYYDDEYEYETDARSSTHRNKVTPEYDNIPSGMGGMGERRHSARRKNRFSSPRKRIEDDYEDYLDVEKRPSQNRRKIDYVYRYEDRPRNFRPTSTHYLIDSREDQRGSNSNKKMAHRPKTTARPVYSEDDYYYDDEEPQASSKSDFSTRGHFTKSQKPQSVTSERPIVVVTSTQKPVTSSEKPVEIVIKSTNEPRRSDSLYVTRKHRRRTT